MKRLIVITLFTTVFTVSLAPAAIIGVAGGTAAPAATLGPYTMTPFPLDARPTYTSYTSVPSPLGGNVGFSIALDHRRIGAGWATWSHGYTGDVYYTNGATAVTLSMPSATGAFYLYAEPNPFSVWEITATAQDGTVVSQYVDGSSGAAYFGFYGTGGSLISTIAVSCGTDFAVGEFGIASGTGRIPAPGAMLLGGIGASLVGWLRRRKTL